MEELQRMKAVRAVIVVLILLNLCLVAVATYVAITAPRPTCPKRVVVDVIILATVAGIRVIFLVGNGIAQAATAKVMLTGTEDGASDERSNRRVPIEMNRRRCYVRWLWWSRLGTLVLILQIVAACLLFSMVRETGKLRSGKNGKRLHILLIFLPAASLSVVMTGWFTGSDVMSWRLLYKSHEAWSAHYREVFDYCIREALCCMGRYRYLAQAQKAEVNSVASLLGDLVAYRAEGCSHLEVLAGVALLRDYKSRPQPHENQKLEAPEDLVREASILHPYAVAAYTGPLLEMGRRPYCWLFVWLYHQGFCSLWKRSRRPVLEGDNLWRGHAGAFLRHARLPPEALRKGRVLQTNRESAYFVVVLKELRTVLVAVRGTETPEDLITDGLSKETRLTESDLLGLLKGSHVPEEVRQQVQNSKHFAHDGIIRAARELSMQLDNLAEHDTDAMTASDMASIEGYKGDEFPGGDSGRGLLSNLLGPKGECEGYHLRLVGHSLGGAVTALTGLRLYRRYPNLHVYAFGVLPCVDEITAKACAGFVTSVVYHDEFSSRLSVASILRLRANALKALVNDTMTNRATSDMSTQINLGGQDASISSTEMSTTSSSHPFSLFSSEGHSPVVYIDSRGGLPLTKKKWSELGKTQRLPYMLKGGVFLCAHTCFCVLKMSHHHKATPISSEVERAILALSKPPKRDVISSKCDGQIEHIFKDADHEPETLTTLSPPVPPTITGVKGVTRAEGPISVDMTRTWNGELTIRDLKRQTYKSEGREREEDSDESTGRRNGMTKELGLGISGMLGHKACTDVQDLWPEEMFLPGLVMHLVREEKPTGSWKSSFWYTWQAEANTTNYRAFVVDRKEFRELVVSPSMFIDHMPWKCQHALNLAVKQLNNKHTQTALDIV